MNEYDKRLDFDSDTFEGMKHDMNFVLQTEETQPAEEEGTDEPTEEQSGEPAEEEPEDITDDIMGDTDTEGYDYEDPEE